MENQEIKKSPEFLGYILELNEGRSLDKAFKKSITDIDALDLAQLNRIGHQVYAKDKWTVHTILQHLIDWERIWCYRAIVFARNEGNTPDALDQEIMAENSNANERTIEELIDEMKMVRQSTIALFGSFDENLLQLSCEFYQYAMPLHTLALAVTSHQIHHFNILEERYWPLDV